MNADGAPATTIAPTLDLQALLATMPDFSKLPSLQSMSLRQSTSSTMGLPVLDSRPRAFSSAAALQRPKPTATPEKRRKRSRKAQEEEQSSVLRMLVDEEDDPPIRIRQPPSTSDLDEKLRKDAAKVLSASSPPPVVAKRSSPERLADLIEEPAIALRRIIRDEDLPDSIGPDSPFRHHPKYQRKQLDSEMMDGMDALMAFSSMSAYVGESSEPTPSPKNDSGYTSAGSPKKSFAEMMEHAICRELVTAE
ncbi:hypothetical protein TELCIR_09205 [Teladorsagia circumcincta]|uniref:Uncharacterized protein n=1 Tax=Teladorsagia circumcincta TaxID=45464 RepID=A0A2G9UFG7_TELCI|nr:hypothetical protein TELCIR_09205 [Teladorsagia circumcincta]